MLRSTNIKQIMTLKGIMPKIIKKAVIPAAGFGTRFLPASKIIPKELFPIVDIPSVQHIVLDLMEAGPAGLRTPRMMISALTESVQNFPALPAVAQELERLGKLYPKHDELVNSGFVSLR